MEARTLTDGLDEMSYDDNGRTEGGKADIGALECWMERWIEGFGDSGIQGLLKFDGPLSMGLEPSTRG